MRSNFSSLAAAFCFAVAFLANHVSAEVIFEDLHLVPGFLKAHGIIMGTTFLIVLPIGALLIRFAKFRGAVWLHATWQAIGWMLMIAGLAIGIRMAKIIGLLHNNTHTIFGTVIVAMLLLQPFLGFIHHWSFRKTQGPTAWTHIHVWYGRILVLLGMINGGLGLKLAANTTGGMIAYGVVAGVVGVIYLVVVVGFEWKKASGVTKQTSESETGERSKQNA